MIPLLMQWLDSQYVTVPVESLFLNAVKVVLFPIALGVICHAIFKEKIEKVTVALPIVSQVAILLIIGVVVAVNGSKLFVASSLLAIPVVILHNLCGYALGFGFSPSSCTRCIRRASATRSRRPSPSRSACRIPLWAPRWP